MVKQKRMLLIPLLLASVLLLFAFGAAPALAEDSADPEKAEWTVLFYLCGSDLESKHSYAAGNLREIASVKAPESRLSYFAGIYGEQIDESSIRKPGKVNVLIQTGGAKQWHDDGLGMKIRPDMLQRWKYEARSGAENAGTFSLEQELPLASMAAPETLTDFITWAVSAYPAEKIALVLWDHGGGSKTGIFIDELFEGDVMHLNELQSALRESNVMFETVLFDACLMANIETASAVQSCAKWMVASEEAVAGKGTAIGEWLQQLYFDPECDGERLGRWICDMSQIKYSEEDDVQAQTLLTWSLIRLSAVPRLASVFDGFFYVLGQTYQRYPRLLAEYTGCMREAGEYGSGQENMYDIAGIFYHPDLYDLVDIDLRRDMLDALADAVVYAVRGAGRSAARGISFCYGIDFSAQELDVYAQNCPCPHYLALLDAITPWSAPDWVYELADHLPEMEDTEHYQLSASKRLSSDGTPGFSIAKGDRTNLSAVRYELLRLNEETGLLESLGMKPAAYDRRERLYYAEDLWRWPTVEDEFCSLQPLNMPKGDSSDILYNIPLRVDTDLWNLRCSFSPGTGDYTIYGLWEGYDSHTSMFNRNVKALAQLAGQEFSLLHPIDAGQFGSASQFSSGSLQIMYRSLSVEEAPLPAGTYVLQFVTYDLFMRPMPLDRAELSWDGQTITRIDPDWTGTVDLNIPAYYW